MHRSEVSPAAFRGLVVLRPGWSAASCSEGQILLLSFKTFRKLLIRVFSASTNSLHSATAALALFCKLLYPAATQAEAYPTLSSISTAIHSCCQPPRWHQCLMRAPHWLVLVWLHSPLQPTAQAAQSSSSPQLKQGSAWSCHLSQAVTDSFRIHRIESPK